MRGLHATRAGSVLTRTLAAIALVALVSTLTRSSRSAVPCLARAIEGEGAGLFADRDEVGAWIAHTVLNRVASPWWPESVEEVVLGGFHGYARVARPLRWATDLAVEALAREEDLAQGALFVLSGEDLRIHGWAADGAIRVYRQGGRSLYFFVEWPGREVADVAHE